MTATKFIVFEGLDGAGSTTQMTCAAKHMYEQSKSIDVLLTREPTTHSSEGKRIRRQLMHSLLPGEEPVKDPTEFTQLFVDDRRYHVEHIIEPALGSHQQVLSDRYALSTCAYQSRAIRGNDGLDITTLVEMHEGLLLPDLTIFVDIPAEVAGERIKQNREDKEYFEALEFLKRVREGYLEAINIWGEEHNVVIVDGSPSIEQVTAQIKPHIDRLYGW